MIPVAEALERCLALVGPLPAERVPLREARGRVLAGPVAASHDQPPFDASAMDGWAVRAADARPGARLRIIGEAAAGRPFAGQVGAGEAARILTGAPMPDGAERVVIQEEAERAGDALVLGAEVGAGANVRPAGGDFAAGERIEAPRRITPEIVALAAAMGHAELLLARRPTVAVMATGDELVPPGGTLAPGQIFASGAYGIAAMIEAAGGEARLLPIARDTREALRFAFGLAEGADVVVTIGGASVGDHDLVGPVARELGANMAFHQVAIRPGKPLMAGRLGPAALVGLPGNPVSAMVCARVFLVPMIRRMLGLPPQEPTFRLPLAASLGPNGPRAHYMRARLEGGRLVLAESQDSSLLRTLAGYGLLAVRPPDDPAREAGEALECLPMDVGAGSALFDTDGERT